MHDEPARRDQRSLSAPGQAPQRPLVAWAVGRVRGVCIRRRVGRLARGRRGGRRPVGADARAAAGPCARRARRAVRAAGDRDRRGGVRLRHRLSAVAPRARGAAGARGRPVLGVDGALHGGDGRARVRARPGAAVRLLRPHRGRVVLPDRLRPRAARGARRGADGAAGDRRERGGDADRRGAALRRVRHVLAARAVRARRAPARPPRSPAR